MTGCLSCCHSAINVSDNLSFDFAVRAFKTANPSPRKALRVPPRSSWGVGRFTVTVQSSAFNLSRYHHRNSCGHVACRSPMQQPSLDKASPNAVRYQRIRPVPGRRPGDSVRRGECGSRGSRLVTLALGRLGQDTPGRHHDRTAGAISLDWDSKARVTDGGSAPAVARAGPACPSPENSWRLRARRVRVRRSRGGCGPGVSEPGEVVAAAGPACPSPEKSWRLRARRVRVQRSRGGCGPGVSASRESWRLRASLVHVHVAGIPPRAAGTRFRLLTRAVRSRSRSRPPP